MTANSIAQPPSVGFLGLGVMGFEMAGHLAKAGHPVVVFNRSRAKAETWAAQFATADAIATSPADLARRASVVCSCIGRDDDLRAVAYGDDGLLAGWTAAATTAPIWVDHTTASATVARELAVAMAALPLPGHFVDAPVSGGQVGAQQGQLSVMAGGDATTLAAVQPLLSCYAKAVRHLGPVGHGQLTKMVNQICIAGLLQGLSEALRFAECAGLDGEAVIAAISQGAAQSWQLDHRATTMLRREFDFGFAVEWMRKDLGLVLDEARRNGAPLPMTALVDQFYGELQQQGGARWDTSSLIARFDAPKSGD